VPPALRRGRRIAGALVLLAACSDGPQANPDTATPIDATTAPTTTVATVGPPPSQLHTATTTPAAVTSSPPGVISMAPTPVTSPADPPVTSAELPVCMQPRGELTTTSDRRVLLRADGVTGPAATIVVLHGYTGTPTGIETYAQITILANDLGIAVAYPEGTPTGGDGSGWNTGASVFSTHAGDDIAALTETLDAIIATGCVDPERITLVGESNGGAMALLAACTPQLAERFTRAVLVNAAVDDGVLERCPGGGVPIPLTAVAGALDETVPLNGGKQLMPVADWFTAASSIIAGCTGVAPAPPLDTVVTRHIGTGCSTCTELLVVADGTHTWPGTNRGVSGLVPGTFALNELLIAASLANTNGCLTNH